MIHRSGTDFSQIVDFSGGAPTGNLTWTLFGETGQVVSSGTIIPVAGALSLAIVVPSAFNTLGSGVLSGFRDLAWSYITGGRTLNDDVRYSVEARPPFGVREDGVRSKLGVASHELPDEDIALVRAYYDFQSLVGLTTDLAPLLGIPRARLEIADAIEALAALRVLPTLQVRIANKESSGTSTYQREKIDWENLMASLQTLVADAVAIVLPGFDPLVGFGAVFILGSPTADAITGA